MTSHDDDLNRKKNGKPGPEGVAASPEGEPVRPVAGAGSEEAAAPAEEDAAQPAAGTDEAAPGAEGAGRGPDAQGARPPDLEKDVARLEARLAELETELASSSERVATLTDERDTWQSKAAAIHDQYLRVRADFDSFRKRSERDFEDRLTRAKSDFILALLDVSDNFRRFLQAAREAGQGGGERSFESFLEGVAMIERQLMDVLRKEGVEPIEDPVGKPMDPALHEAIAAREGAGEHGTVIEELQRGYTYKGSLLRPSRVTVAK